jgi:hypothetical protein
MENDSATTMPYVSDETLWDIAYLSRLQRLNSINSKNMNFFVRYLGFPWVLGIPSYRKVTRFTDR